MNDENSEPHNSCEKQWRWTSEMEEMLIDEVKSREPLWNHTLPVSERATIKIHMLWSDIAEILKRSFEIPFDILTPAVVSKKWKDLLDYFWRKQGAKKRSAESTDGKKRVIWKHEAQMMFLTGLARIVPVVSDNDDENFEEVKFQRPYRRVPKRPRREEQQSQEVGETFTILANSPLEMQLPTAIPIQPEETKQSALKSFFKSMESIMSTFPEDLQHEVMFQIHMTIDEARRKFKLSEC